MGEPKAFASLSSGLLARKGAARPAMRPQGFGQVGGNVDDLGWNDMGFEAPKAALAPVRDENHDAFGEELPDQPLRNPIAALTPIASPVHDQQAEIAERFAAHDEEGEDEEGEYIDETAELCDLDTDNEVAAAVAQVESELEVEPAPVVVMPVRAPAPAPVRSRRPRAAPGSKGKAAFTLRLDPSRHLKLRLACAVDGRSAQQLVTDALDRLLNEMPELDSMAERAPAKKRAEG
jgi:hypothetical protein